MSKIKYLSCFDKRISFSSSIINRNENLFLNYKSKIPLVLKQESLDTQNSNVKVEHKTFKYFINNESFFNKYIDENLINLYSFKLTSHIKNQSNKEVSLQNKTFLTNNIKRNTLRKYENNTNHKPILSISKNIFNKKNINDEEYSLKENTLSKKININDEEYSLKENTLSKKININESFIFKKEKEIENNLREKEIEKRVIKYFEENINENTIHNSINKVNISTIENKHILNQRNERILTNRIYQSVIKKWDKETKRKGYLYE